MTEEPDLTISRQNEPSAASDRHVVNRWAGRAGYTYNSPGREPLEFHQRMPDYSPTRLIDSPELALSLAVPKLFVKDEFMRLGLPAASAKCASACFQGSRGMVDDVLRPLRETWERGRNSRARRRDL